jgi:ribosomal protein L9
MMVKEIMGMSPLFGQFMAEKGLNFILDNMEGKGVEELKDLTDGWLKQYEQEKQQAMQAANQNPAAMKAQVDMQKMQMQAQENQQKMMLEQAKLKHEEKKLEVNLKLGEQSSTVQLVKAQTERFAKQVDLKIKSHDMRHRHVKEALELHHKVHTTKNESRQHA